jgi:hypothetical protein
MTRRARKRDFRSGSISEFFNDIRRLRPLGKRQLGRNFSALGRIEPLAAHHRRSGSRLRHRDPTSSGAPFHSSARRRIFSVDWDGKFASSPSAASRHRISTGWRGRSEVASDRHRPHCWRSSAGREGEALRRFDFGIGADDADDADGRAASVSMAIGFRVVTMSRKSICRSNALHALTHPDLHRSAWLFRRQTFRSRAHQASRR